MLHSLLLTALPLLLALHPPTPQDGNQGQERGQERGQEKEKEKEKERLDLRKVFETAQRMREALEKGTREEQLALLTEAAELPHNEIATVLEEYGRTDDKGVRTQAVETLRWLQDPRALEALHNLYEVRAYPRDDEWREAIAKGIGQHASQTSIKLLAEPPKSFQNTKAIRAQIWALARIRHRRSVEALIELMPRFGRHRDQFLGDFHFALVVLTGMDKGQNPAFWVKWWEEEQQRFRVPDNVTLPPPQMKRWVRYWNLPDPETERGPR